MGAVGRRRVSYVIPPPTEPVPRLQLPPIHTPASPPRSSAPLLRPSPVQPALPRTQPAPAPAPATQHPRHRLGVACLALDPSTHLVGRHAPEGILYTGGRDGLVIAWDLAVPMRPRSRPPQAFSSYSPRVAGRFAHRRWDLLTGWGDDVIDEDVEEEDEIRSDGDILGDVKGSGKRRRPSVSDAQGAADARAAAELNWEIDPARWQDRKPSQFRQSAQAHTDWVNDILLCNYNQTVVSASSDGSVKAWNPHASQQSPGSSSTAAAVSDPVTVGTHRDYVRCLAQSREQKYIVSGSFDRTIKLWDLSRSTTSLSSLSSTSSLSSSSPSAYAPAPARGAAPLMTLSPPDAAGPKASVYALAVDPLGHTIAAGGPERVVRLWDPRAGKRIGKLVGHTDNIRAMVVSEDARYLLTASADASIKLWSLASQRCLHTFMHHTDSVWSLHSTHPSLEVFYSGDRSGYVCRVDVEGCAQIAEGECVVLCRDADSGPDGGFDGGAGGYGGGYSGGSTDGGRGGAGVNKIVAMDDGLVWTASGSSSLRRWRAPPRRAVRAAAMAFAFAPELEQEHEPDVEPDVDVECSPDLDVGAHAGVHAGAGTDADADADVDERPAALPIVASGTRARTGTGTKAGGVHRKSRSMDAYRPRSLALENGSALPALPSPPSTHSPSTISMPMPVGRAPPRHAYTVGAAYPSDGHTGSGFGSASSAGAWSGGHPEGATTWYGLPFASLVRLASPHDAFAPYSPLTGAGGAGTGARARDADVATLYSAASVLSVPRGPAPALVHSPLQAVFPATVQTQGLRSASPVQSEALGAPPSPRGDYEHEHEEGHGGEEGSPHGAARRSGRAEFEQREVCGDAVPLCGAPDAVIAGERGLVRAIVLNDRVHALTVDTATEVRVWDLVRGVCVGAFLREDLDGADGERGGSTASGGSASGSGVVGRERERSPREALEIVRERIEGEAVVMPWSTVDTKIGVLTVHVDEKCFDAELYADEVRIGSDRHYGEEHRLNLGRWVLRNLFINFIREEQRAYTRRVRGTDGSQRGGSPPPLPQHTHTHTHTHSHSHVHMHGTVPPSRRRSSSTSSKQSVSAPSPSPSPSHTAVFSSPTLIPAVTPSIPWSSSASPLLTPKIPLYQPLSPIQQSPSAASAPANDATPVAGHRHGHSKTQTDASTTPVAHAPHKEQHDYFTVRVRRPSVSSGAAAVADVDDFSGWGGPGGKLTDAPATPTAGGLMGRLKNIGKISKRPPSEAGPATPRPTTSGTDQVPVAPDTTDVLAPGPTVRTPAQAVLASALNPPTSADNPTLPLNPAMPVMVQEEASPDWTVVYFGSVSSTGADVRALEEALPVWLLEFLLLGKAPAPPVTKIGFVLLPYQSKEPDAERLPELLNTAQSKLTASRFLRVRKLTAHVQDKIDKMAGGLGVASSATSPRTSPRSSADTHRTASSSSPANAAATTAARARDADGGHARPRPDETWEILCNDVVLPLDMTLAAVRQFVWRQAAELTMHYRRKRQEPVPLGLSPNL